ncbi:MAG: potassium channel family protein [Ktedonobacteraceae bacterium]
MNVPSSFRHLRIAAILVLGVMAIGTAGYMLLEQLTFVDALYTTIGMMTTVGLLIQPLSPGGRLFSIFVMVFGIGSLLYTLGVGMEFLIEGHLNKAIWRKFMDKKIAALRNHYIICGFGRVGSRIAEDFTAAGLAFVVIDDNEANVQVCTQHGYLALQGDATSDERLREAGIKHAKCLLVATDNDANNIYITLSARHLNTKIFIVARANHDETEAKLKLAGADRVLSPYTIGGHRMANLAFQPGVIEFFDSVTRAGNVELAVQEIVLANSSPLVGKTMADAQNALSDDTMIVALKKPSGLISGSRQQTRIEAGDAVIVVGIPNRLAAFKEAVGK